MPRPASALVSLALLALAACTMKPATSAPERGRIDGAAPGGHVISRADIARTGATNAFEAVERARTHLMIMHTSDGRDAGISHRGAGSILLGNAVLLVVDGNRVQRTASVLRAIPASSIVFIQVLSAREAAVRWGSDAGNGVILVKTSAR